MFLHLVLVALILDDALAKARVDVGDTASSDLQNHPRIMDNCKEKFAGAEGTHVKGFHMQRVFIATTPGLLTPRVHHGQTSHHPNDHSHFCSFEKMTRYADIKGYLETVTMKEKFHNKKVKAAFKNFEPVPNAKDCGRNSLSSFGVLQLINLGKYLFKSYFGKLKSLDSMFLSHECASTVGDQTLFQSLNALLYGLLNEKQFVYTHVDKLSSDFSTPSQVTKTQHSLHYFVEQSFLKENHLFKDTKVFASNTGYITGTLSGADVSSKDIISYLSNSLCPKLQNHAEILGISNEDISHIFNLSDSYNHYLIASSLFWSYSAARTVSMWNLVQNWLSPNQMPHKQEASESNNDDLKIITVDDLFMFSILRTLNVPVSKHTTPASRLVVERFVLLEFDSVARSLSPSLGQGNKDIFVMKQKGIDKKSLPESILQNHLTVFNFDNISEKTRVNDSLRLENVHKRELSMLPTDKIPTFKINSEDKTSEKFKLPRNNTFQTYIRLLHNGQVITSLIPGCKSDTVIKWGMCSFEIFENFLNSIK